MRKKRYQVPGFGGCWGWVLALLGGWALAGAGCQRAAPPPESAAAPTPQANSNAPAPTSGWPRFPTNLLGQELAARDEVVWRDELAARLHEEVFVQLADQMRQAPEPAAVLSQLRFETLRVPQPLDSITLTLGIREQKFSSTNFLTLSSGQWQKALEQFREAGWNLRQFAWQQERFLPATGSGPARSEFAFEWQGEQPAQTNRFILRGVLLVEWAKPSMGQPVQLRHLAFTNLTLLERSGPVGFTQHALIAPEPERPNGRVNLHPLIVMDVNGDRHEDIILPGVNKVLLNDGRANLQAVDFVKPEHFYPLQEAGVMADFTGDGRLDFLGVTERGPAAKRLILHAGDGTLPFGPSMTVWERQQQEPARYLLNAASVLTAGDVDGDGDLDVFIAQYRPPYARGNLPTPYYDANDGYPSYLLLNDGRGHFELAAPQAALAAKSHRRTLSASLVDLDNDGDLDLVTLNDFSGVDLFYNDGRGRFKDESALLDDRHLFGMGQAVADFDGDGVLDLLAIGMDIPTVRRLEALRLAPAEWPERTRNRAAMAWGNRLYLARNGKWTEPAWASSVARTGWSWGTSVFDFDNDGALDFYVANGHVSGASSADYDSFYWTRDIYLDGSGEDPVRQGYFEEALRGLNSGQTSWHGYQHNALFVDTGTNHYVNVAWLMGVAHQTDCRAVSSADLNEDGRPDLLVTEAIWHGRPEQMRHRLLVHLNQISSQAHWIGVRFLPAPSLSSGPSGTSSRASPLGAKIFIQMPGRTLIKQVLTGDSFQAQHPFTVHFGLGASTEVSELKIRWIGGRTQVLTHPAVDRYYQVD